MQSYTATLLIAVTTAMNLTEEVAHQAGDMTGTFTVDTMTTTTGVDMTGTFTINASALPIDPTPPPIVTPLPIDPTPPSTGGETPPPTVTPLPIDPTPPSTGGETPPPTVTPLPIDPTPPSTGGETPPPTVTPLPIDPTPPTEPGETPAGYFSNDWATNEVCWINHYCPAGTEHPNWCGDEKYSYEGSESLTDCKDVPTENTPGFSINSWNKT
jgi:hypothetical protein